MGPSGPLSCRIAGGTPRCRECGAPPGRRTAHRAPRSTELGRPTHVRKVIPMLEIDIALVRQHLKADDEDVETELIEQYISSAVTICESYCNRKFYQDADALAADRTVALAALEAAK